MTALGFGLAIPGGAAGAGDQGRTPPPGAWTKEAFGIESSEAVLVGYVKPSGRPSTTYWFQWGRTRSYGHREPEVTEDQMFDGEPRREVMQGLSCLRQKTTYHFRIVAQSGSGTTYGRDKTFTTTRRHAPYGLLYGECPGHKPIE